ncbi:Mg/Co/Ni transporter MgtE with CBS domain [Desulfosporosinus acidiphilus SJ4]|uniref:Mg/Co/Ni transporter MgtE with CBS domain n=2 Tax=Desulfosporosinus TaxID=79206 RepID=I4D3X3_DESAJ|nr:Mg/Co/Ni transporter MgtE with CBS domain [Desulfosporosinus acidiphilus SJ4]
MELLTDLFVSELIGKYIIDRSGLKLGKVRDVWVDPETTFPTVRGLIIKYNGELKVVPWKEIYMLSRQVVALRVIASEVRFERVSEGHLYISGILDRQIVDINGAKLVRVNDIKLAGNSKGVHIVSIDVSFVGLIRRLLPRGMFSMPTSGKRLQPHFIGWDMVQSLSTGGDSLSLRASGDKLSKIHPADLADILENISHYERLELFEQLNPEMAADTLAEVDPDVQKSILRQINKERAADILEEMEQDEAADLLSEMNEDDSDQLLSLMENEAASDLRELLEYDEGTAGSLMTTDFLVFSIELTADEVIKQLRELAPEADYIYYLYAVDSEGRLKGVISLRELIISSPETRISELMHTKVISVLADEDEKKIRRLFSKYSLLALPVIDKSDKVIGLITVDDVLQLKN